ncbi:DNA polymerase III subunit beta [Rhizobium leguminosarum]|uniref:DNA polymerase III subunit beta n=1 Tax=Rhizobium ruizarguesonis TaxID=2081791 RepID=UPI0013B80B40|nr:DNA polymerase III subunit beta [Rhizobium ruizarguesonis]NEJ10458.1 DNA polymerase III subunit beta [Rhizobium ruizarguesonis]
MRKGVATAMQVTVTGKDLLAAMNAVMAAIEPQTSIPILKSVRLTVHPDKLTVTGTDLDTELTADVDVLSAEGMLDICIPAELLRAAVRYAGVSPVVIRLDEVEHKRKVFNSALGTSIDEAYTNIECTVDVAGGDRVFVISDTFPASDWPTLAVDATFMAYESFTNGQLPEILERVAVAISNEETRYYLNGIYWEPGAFTATDGHRLVSHPYASFMETPKGSNAPVCAIIPTRSIKVLLSQAKGDVRTSVCTPPGKAPLLKFEFGDTRLVTKTIDGTFPDYRRVIPPAEPTDTKVSFSAAVLRQALLSAVTFYKINRSRNGIAIRNDDGRAVLTTKAEKPDNKMQGGAFTARTFADWPKDSTMTHIGLNMRYLLDFVPKGGNLVLQMKDSGAPARVMVEGQDDVTRLVMPMRV